MITLTPSASLPNTYSLNWGAQQSHILDGLRSLVGGGQDDLALTDVTLACDGEYIQAHKLVLSLCSSFFKDLFQKNRVDKSNTIVIVSQVSPQNLRYLLKFMYQGRVDIPSKNVDSFLQAGNLLKIEGLIGNVGSGGGSDAGHGQTDSFQSYQQSATAGSSQSYRSQRAYPPPQSFSSQAPSASAIRISGISSTKCDSSATPTKKARIVADGAAATASPSTSGNLPVSLEGSSMIGGTTIAPESTDASNNPDLSTQTSNYDPLDNANEYATGEMEEGEEGVDFDNLKTEPIQIYSGYEDGSQSQSEMVDEGNEDETYEESGDGDDSYGFPPVNISLGAPIPSGVPGPSTSSQSQGSRPRGNIPVILNGQYFQIKYTDDLGGVKAKCMVCQKWSSKNVLISGRITSTSNFTTHLKRRHPPEYKAYNERQASKSRNPQKSAAKKVFPNQGNTT